MIALIAIVFMMVRDRGGDDDQAAVVVSPTAAATTTSPAAPPRAPVSQPPDQPRAQSVAPTPTEAPPTPAPTMAPPPAPAALPDRTSCGEIAGTPYRSETERQWYLDHCTGGTAPQPTASSGSPPPATGFTAEEQTYVNRASAQASAFYSRFAQYFGQPSYGLVGDQLELANVNLNFANGLSAIQPVPDRFYAYHYEVIAAALYFHDVLQAVQSITTLDEYYVWVDYYYLAFDELDYAFSNYVYVTGIQVPTLGGLR